MRKKFYICPRKGTNGHDEHNGHCEPGRQKDILINNTMSKTKFFNYSSIY